MNQNHPERVGRRAFLRGAGATAGAAALLPVLGTASDAAPAAHRVPRELRPGGEFDKFVARLAAEDEFSGTVRLEYRDHPVLERSYGMADRARSIPNDPDTIYPLASVTKLFTGIAIAQLVEQAKVGYHERLGTYLDGFAPDVAGTVAIHHLLTHTSGLGDYHVGDFWDEAETWTSVEEAWEGTLRYVRMDTLEFPPGAGNTYSNSGFVALGAIVAEVSGQPYHDYVRDHIFGAAGTTSSDFFTLPEWRTDRRLAHPYAKDDSGEYVDKVDDRQTFVGTPAGGSFATAADLVTIVKALQRGDLLDPRYAQLAISPKLPRPAPENAGGPPQLSFSNYLTLGDLSNHQWIYGHGGGSPGVSANLHWFPDSGWVVAVLANYDGAAGAVSGMARRLILG
jgi:CubicO group peptidase (beta-lactamase class C family)